jgi:rare lipoprotein A
MKMQQYVGILLAILAVVIGLVPHAQARINYRLVPVLDSAVGIASFYADKFVGRKTANGDFFSQDKLTCAHNTLPFGTRVKVTNLQNGKSVVVRVNDRLHHRNSRLVDLSKAAAMQLGLNKAGIVRVLVEVEGKKNLDLPIPDK